MASSFLYEGQKLPLRDFIQPFLELEPDSVLKGKLKGHNIISADVIKDFGGLDL